MKKAFSLVELLIVIAILGILAAIVLPEFTTQTQQAKEAVAKDSLRLLRNVVEIYAARNNGVPPGYYNNDPAQGINQAALCFQLPKYLPDYPENPFNGISVILLVADGQPMPDAGGPIGWFYKPQTKTIVINQPGTDSQGVDFRDY